MGKRLPHEAEYEFAATNGGKSKYPWGDDPTKIQAWTFGPVGQPDYDRTLLNAPIYGLFSNVAEWTLSRSVAYPGSQPLPGAASEFRVIRGGTRSVATGNPDLTESPQEWNPRFRMGWAPGKSFEGVGFRCARSAKPRFLKP